MRPLVLVFALVLAGNVSAQVLEVPGVRSVDGDLPGTKPSTLDLALPRTGAAPQAGRVDPALYRLGPGDVLELRLWGRLARSLPLTVDPEGRLQLPDQKPIVVDDRTLEDVRREVLAAVSRTFRGVEADLRLARMRSFKVYVTGEVRAPGAVEATPVVRVSEALAGTALTDRASQRNIVVLHRDGSQERADLVTFHRTGDATWNPWLRDGDVLKVPVANRYVYAQGAFSSPGSFELAPGDRLSTLVRLAGGFQPSADRARASFSRFSGPTRRDSVRVNLSDDAGESSTLALQDGDAVFVPYVPEYHRLYTATILGEVSSPGIYPIELGHHRLSDLVRWAGGFSTRADLQNVYLVRPSPSGTERDPEFERLVKLTRDQMTESEYSKLELRLAEQRNSFRIDWRRVSEGRERADLDLVLNDGDVFRVDQLMTSVRVDGQVRNPGLIEYVPGRSPHEYIRLAGGLTQRGAGGGIRLTRRGTRQVVAASKVRSVQPGDVIWVPEKRDHDPWNVLRDVLTVLGQAAVVIVAVRR